MLMYILSFLSQYNRLKYKMEIIKSFLPITVKSLAWSDQFTEDTLFDSLLSMQVNTI